MSPDRSGVGEEADSGMTGDAATAAGALEVIAGDPQTCPGDQHVVGAKPAATGRVEGEMHRGGSQAIVIGIAVGLGPSGMAFMAVMINCLMDSGMVSTAVSC